MAALVKQGWIRLGDPVKQSRFRKLLQGPGAKIFRVSSRYELQPILDWICGDASRDGAAYSAVIELGTTSARRLVSFKAQKATAKRSAGDNAPQVRHDGEGNLMLDPDPHMLVELLPQLNPHQQTGLLVRAISPAEHRMSDGFYATRLFAARL